MKKTLIEEKNRIIQLNKLLNEQTAFNDGGEPMMTHSQFRDYSEPAEPDYDNGNDYESPQSKDDVVKAIENHFDTILETYNGKEYNFLTKNFDSDLMLWFNSNHVGGIAGDGNNFEEQYIEELDINELIQFFEPYHQYILSGDEANREMDNISKQNSQDSTYARQERGAMGGY